MTTFDAGSIEATLRLDRSPFDRTLRDAQRDGDKFGSKTFTAKIDAENRKANDAIAETETLYDSLRRNLLRETEANVKTDEAEREVLSLEAAYEILRENLQRTIHIEVDADTLVADTELEATTAEVDRLRRKRISLLAIFGGGGIFGFLGSIGSAFSGIGGKIQDVGFEWLGLFALITTFAPLIAAALITLTGLVGGLAAGFVAAFGAVASIGIIAIPLFTKLIKDHQALTKAQQQYNTAVTDKQRQAALLAEKRATDNLSGSQRVLFGMLQQIISIYHKLEREFATPLAVALRPWFAVVRDLLGMLPTVLSPALHAFRIMGQTMKLVVADPQTQHFFRWLGHEGAFAMTQFFLVLVNLGKGFGALIMAFTPLMHFVLPGLVDLSRAFSDWAQNVGKTQGFKEFVQFVEQNAPLFGHLILGLILLFLKFTVAIAPLAHAMLVVLNAVVSFLNTLGPNNLNAALIGIGLLAAALGALFGGVPLLVAGAVTAVLALVALIVHNWPKIAHVFSAGVHWLVGFWTAQWNLVRNVFADALAFIADTMLKLVGFMIHGAASAFGWVPGIGPKLRHAAAQFDSFVDSVNAAIDRIRPHKTISLTWQLELPGGGQQVGGQNPVHGFRGYARGTKGAKPGWAWTGEAGKELVYFHGGETVLSHRDSMKVTRGYASGTVDVSERTQPGVNTWSRELTQSVNRLSQQVAQQDAKKWQNSLGGMMPPGAASYGVARWASTILQVLALLGQPLFFLSAVEHRMQQESGGNPYAINLWDSNAKAGDPSRGLMQTIGSTFNAYAGPFRGLGIYNPLANIYAGLNYALHAYPGRSLASVMLQPGGYDSGGPLPPGYHFVHNGTGRTEEVLTPSERHAFVSFVKMLKGGSGAGGSPLIGTYAPNYYDTGSTQGILGDLLHMLQAARQQNYVGVSP